jgi:hypothetical protein
LHGIWLFLNLLHPPWTAEDIQWFLNRSWLCCVLETNVSSSDMRANNNLYDFCYLRCSVGIVLSRTQATEFSLVFVKDIQPVILQHKYRCLARACKEERPSLPAYSNFRVDCFGVWRKHVHRNIKLYPDNAGYLTSRTQNSFPPWSPSPRQSVYCAAAAAAASL